MKTKIKLDANLTPYPMPMVLVGAKVRGKPNFLAVAWFTKVNYDPAMIGVALGQGHHTNEGILENKCFSVNIPSTEQIIPADYCGIVTGNKKNKSGVFETFDGELGAPLIVDCPVSIECKLVQKVELPGDLFFIGRVKAIYSEERYLTDGKLDLQKTKPFLYTSPDKGYWSIGSRVGKAYSDGKKFSGRPKKAG